MTSVKIKLLQILNKMELYKYGNKGYQGQLPFYQRIYTAALTHSLGLSMNKSGIAHLSYQEAGKLLK